MANKRQKKKQQTRQNKIYLTNAGYSKKQVKKLSYKETTSIVAEERKKEKKRTQAKQKYNKALRLQTWKFNELVAKGFEPETLTTTLLRKIKVEDIKNNRLTMLDYPELYPQNRATRKQARFDFNKVYRFNNGKCLYFAYRDFYGENDFETLVNRYDKMSNSKLISLINAALNTPPGYSKSLKKKKRNKEIEDIEGNLGDSNGKAGDYRFMCGPENVVRRASQIDFYTSAFAKKRQHTGNNNTFQTLTDESGSICIKEFTVHKLLAVSCAIMYNVTEQDRFAYYRRMYIDVTGEFPEIAEVLPPPVRY